jgi:hypothetical protein
MDSDSLAALIVPPSIIALLVIVFYALGVFDTLGGSPIARVQKATSSGSASVPRALAGRSGAQSETIRSKGIPASRASPGSPVPEYRPPAANAPMRPGPRTAAMPPVPAPVVQDSNASENALNQAGGDRLQQMPVVPEALPEQGATAPVQEEAVPDAEQAAAESADEQELQRQQELQDQQDQLEQQQQQVPQQQQQ